ncbi:hypothetical protein PZT66_24840 [Pseudomonas aeruginosa]|uniref:hypothetical protein n=1 Tax=Pseudomonas aeruginosa TaxID=287 RepID=UPI0005B4D0ED|nr:hypothetical protein [Pseudomonas aeruginosa]EIU2716208.1 hypothetical protein [Pseudomonas aeruginosa]EIU2863027.1 hypothetical protein [Pseudomonas aeruginosa]MBA5212879.1 hypothetical protein [Pseudomonas aeruginosa]MBG3916981.1 hypothetical protein [Pseudomonas aeruginosa]MBG4468102.1 hypothetical protein [Pseudomonas aeruginosa]
MSFAANSQVIWTSTEAAGKGPIPVKVVGPTYPSEYDHAEVGQMYDIELPDGSSYSAFEDELTTE